MNLVDPPPLKREDQTLMICEGYILSTAVAGRRRLTIRIVSSFLPNKTRHTFSQYQEELAWADIECYRTISHILVKPDCPDQHLVDTSVVSFFIFSISFSDGHFHCFSMIFSACCSFRTERDFGKLYRSAKRRSCTLVKDRHSVSRRIL
jgi:hypothetical protein